MAPARLPPLAKALLLALTAAACLPAGIAERQSSGVPGSVTRRRGLAATAATVDTAKVWADFEAFLRQQKALPFLQFISVVLPGVKTRMMARWAEGKGVHVFLPAKSPASDLWCAIDSKRFFQISAHVTMRRDAFAVLSTPGSRKVKLNVLGKVGNMALVHQGGGGKGEPIKVAVSGSDYPVSITRPNIVSNKFFHVSIIDVPLRPFKAGANCYVARATRA